MTGQPETVARELHLYEKPHVVVVQCNEDPGDMGEPRMVSEDDTTYVFVPAFNLWPGGEARDAQEAELRARGWQDEYEVATAAAMNYGDGYAAARAEAFAEIRRGVEGLAIEDRAYRGGWIDLIDRAAVLALLPSVPPDSK